MQLQSANAALPNFSEQICFRLKKHLEIDGSLHQDSEVFHWGLFLSFFIVRFHFKMKQNSNYISLCWSYYFNRELMCIWNKMLIHFLFPIGCRTSSAPFSSLPTTRSSARRRTTSWMWPSDRGEINKIIWIKRNFIDPFDRILISFNQVV